MFPFVTRKRRDQIIPRISMCVRTACIGGTENGYMYRFVSLYDKTKFNLEETPGGRRSTDAARSRRSWLSSSPEPSGARPARLAA